MVRIGRLEVIDKKPFFAGPVAVHVSVVIQVVLGKVGKNSRIVSTPVHPGKIQGMGRDFHDPMGDARVGHLPQDRLQIEGLRRGYRIVECLVGIAIVDGSNHAGPVPGFFQDLFQQVGNGGFSIGTRDSHQDHFSGRMAEKTAGQGGQGRSRVGDPDHGGIDRHGLAANHGRGPFFHGFGNKAVTVGGKAFDGHKNSARGHFARVITDGCHVRIPG